jgi:hypothetical protein
MEGWDHQYVKSMNESRQQPLDLPYPGQPTVYDNLVGYCLPEHVFSVFNLSKAHREFAVSQMVALFASTSRNPRVDDLMKSVAKESVLLRSLVEDLNSSSSVDTTSNVTSQMLSIAERLSLSVQAEQEDTAMTRALSVDLIKHHIASYLLSPIIVPQNVALHKHVTQSSTHHDNYPPENAVDGITSFRCQDHWRSLGELRDFKTIFNHTANEHNAWLRVDLGRTHTIHTIRIFNRFECPERLSPFAVFLMDENSNQEMFSRPQSTLIPVMQHAFPHGTVPIEINLCDEAQRNSVRSLRQIICRGLTPHELIIPFTECRYVVLMLESWNFLHITQLEVWGF